MLINSIIFFILILFTQHVSSKTIISYKNNKCMIKHNGQMLDEGDSTDINGKLYKVEDCGLQRAFHVCGTQLMFIINIVCQTVEEKTRVTRFVQQKLLTEACCQSLCTISE